MRLEGAPCVAQGGAKRNPGNGGNWEWGKLGMGEIGNEGKNCVMRLEGAPCVAQGGAKRNPGNGGNWEWGGNEGKIWI